MQPLCAWPITIMVSGLVLDKAPQLPQTAQPDKSYPSYPAWIQAPGKAFILPTFRFAANTIPGVCPTKVESKVESNIAETVGE